jgi:enoyl-CoA hydratase/carnithine racemase
VSELVLVDVADGVAVVLVDHPPVNALSNATVDALAEAGDRLAADDSVRAVVLGGTGAKAFVAGADLNEFSGALGDESWIEDHTGRARRLLDRWSELPQPVVAAVQANAMGGGLEVMLVCDLVVADPSAQFGLPEVRLGLMPGAGGTQRLPLRIGLGPAKELILLGLAVDVEEARRLGLVNRIAAPGAALAEARELAVKLARLSAVSVRAIKRSIGTAANGDLAGGLDRERALFMDVFQSDDAREGVHAFIEKRRPNFGHR